MGDRISISFKNGGDESVALFSHWGGRSFLNIAQKYIKDLKKEVKENEFEPLDRLEPNTIMVDFIKFLFEKSPVGERIASNYYLCKDSASGDNSDNGHFTIDVNKGG